MDQVKLTLESGENDKRSDSVSFQGVSSPKFKQVFEAIAGHVQVLHASDQESPMGKLVEVKGSRDDIVRTDEVDHLDTSSDVQGS